MIRVVICDDHMIVRQSLKQTLGEVGDMSVIDEADNGTDCVRLVQRLRPDVVLLDLALIGRDGLDTLAELRTECPRVPVLMLSTLPERRYAVRCLQAGAAGYLHKSVDTAELAQAVRAVAAGQSYITPAVAEAMAESAHLQRV